jgi:hypothetical protein
MQIIKIIFIKKWHVSKTSSLFLQAGKKKYFFKTKSEFSAHSP